MKIGPAAAKFVNNDIDFNYKNSTVMLEKAKRFNVDLLLFGETYLQGFESLSWKPEIDLETGIEKSFVNTIVNY
ncbi:MAG: hypothetical protein LBC62_01750 [Treponema sp.]|jgi:N-carbamoylputrescine amidase|nr:hypothetical protein [Treponema sp.]